MLDRRNEIRVEINLEIDVNQILIHDKYIELPKPFQIYIQNISCSGMMMTCHLDIPIGTCFFIDLPIDNKIHIIIEIVRCKFKHQQFEYGCKFLQLSDKLESRLRKFIFQQQIKLRH